VTDTVNEPEPDPVEPARSGPSAGAPESDELDSAECRRIGDIKWRQRVRVRGRIRALRVQPWEGGVATLECTLVDDTGGLVVIFMGRRKLGGVKLGAHMEVEGRVLESRGKLAIMNPAYTLLPTPTGA
jgi:hypothetical protein